MRCYAALGDTETCFVVLLSVAQPKPELKVEEGLQPDSSYSRDLNPEWTKRKQEKIRV